MTGYLTFPQIDPIIFSLGPLSVRWYGAMYLLGFLSAIWIANYRVQKPNTPWQGWTKEQVSDLLFYGFLGVILGGRFGYVFFYQFERFLDDPIYLIQIWTGGMSFHGGVIGVVLAIYWFAYKTNKSFLSVGDFICPLLPIGLGAGRIGNFINGELWGRAADVPWAFVFPTADHLPRHPSQLYEFFLEGVVLFILLITFSNKKRPAGSIGGLFLLGYGSFRFTVEYFREPDAHLGLLFNTISMGQLLSLPMVVAGILLLAYSYTRRV